MDLGKNEQAVLRIQKHWMYFFWPLVVTVFTMGIGIVWLIYRALRYYMDEIILTNQKFNIKVGVVSVNSGSTPLSKINNFNYDQGILGRIFGYGTIYIQSAATAGLSGYSYVTNPAYIKSILESTAEKNEQKLIAK
jgi:uncharacterized membrane protein YdbT with pleckstrin-like domain